MVRWFASRPRDVGNQTRAVLGDAARHRSSPARRRGVVTSERSPDAAGNGALMRTGPVALAALGDRDAVARLAADVAAPDPPAPRQRRGVRAVVAGHRAGHHDRTYRTCTFDWVAAVRAGLDHVDPARRDAVDEPGSTRPPAGTPPSSIGNNGWVVGAFQAALAAITSTAGRAPRLPCDHLTAALRAAARAGGDTDTVAAIAGVAARRPLGRDGRPARAGAASCTAGGPTAEPPLTAADLDAMARLAVRGGRPDGSGWPGVAPHGLRRACRPLRRARRRLVRQRRPASPTPSTTAPPSSSRCAGWGPPTCPTGVEHHTVGLVDTTAARQPERRLRAARHRPHDR